MLGSVKTNLPVLSLTSWVKVASPFLQTIPDELKIGGAMPMNSRQSNSIIHQMERGEWKTVDPAGSHHLSKADSDDMLLVLTVHASSKADDACDF